MRKIEEEMVSALNIGTRFKRDNTYVSERYSKDGGANWRQNVWLYGNLIAVLFSDGPRWAPPRKVYFTMAGWPTVTTKSRLSAILSQFVRPGAGIHQQNWEMFFQIEPGEGNEIPLDSHEWIGVTAGTEDIILNASQTEDV